MTVPQARSHGKTPPSEANSVAAEKRAANASRSRASARRRETILDAALVVAAAGGYEAVQMRTVAERVGIAVGTLYRYFPAKTHLLVAALTREFRRLDSAGDWASGEGTPLERLERLTAHLHDRWQRDPWLTTAMTRAFAVADTRAAAELDRAADRDPDPAGPHAQGRRAHSYRSARGWDHLRHLAGQPRGLQRPPRDSRRHPRPH